jgi:DNA-binding XRE family transcriptional regulator
LYAERSSLNTHIKTPMKLTREEMDAEEELDIQVQSWCLKRRRLACHLSQRQLAALAHVSRGEVQHLEHGRHGMREGTKLRLSLALNTSVVEMDAEVARVKQEWKDAKAAKKSDEA